MGAEGRGKKGGGGEEGRREGGKEGGREGGKEETRKEGKEGGREGKRESRKRDGRGGEAYSSPSSKVCKLYRAKNVTLNFAAEASKSNFNFVAPTVQLLSFGCVAQMVTYILLKW